MFHVYDCITRQHDLRLVLLAAVICLFGCHTSLNLLGRARANSHGQIGWAWVSAGAFVAGASVWATHFVAILAFQPGVPIAYHLGLTIVSIIIAVAVIWIGFAIAVAYDRPMIGGIVFGLAVAAMHFTGVIALRVPARLRWDPSFTLTAVAIGMGFAAFGLAICLRRTDLRRQFIGTVLLTLAIAGLHFTAMSAVSFEYDPTAPLVGEMLPGEWLAVAITAVMVLVIGLGLSGAIFDRHLADRAAAEALRLRTYVRELETTRSQLEGTTRDLQSALEAAALASQAKSQFLAAMSHELRTPLNAVIGFSEILTMETFGPLGHERYREYAKNVRESGNHLLSLINDILDFSKLEAGRFELQEDAINLRDVIRAGLRIVGVQAEAKGVLLTEVPSAALPLIQADERRIRQILLNLLSNAIKFTPEGGEVRVSAERVGGGLAVSVTDTGIGIAAEDIPRALERFGQIDNSLARLHEGTGLGLPLSKRLTELHGGTLSLTSTVGFGTTVTVLLPADRILSDSVAA